MLNLSKLEHRRCVSRTLGAIAIGALCVVAEPSRAQAPPISGPALVIDGDPLEIQGLRVRIAGVDAPERNQSCRRRDGRLFPCGRLAADLLRAEIGARAISCKVVDWNPARNGYRERAVGRCVAGGLDIGRWLTRRGLATPSHTAFYVREGLDACNAGRGFWSGSWERPRSFRRGRQPAEMIGRTDGADCRRTILGGL